MNTLEREQLRTYAAFACAGICADPSSVELDRQQIARASFAIAKQMILEERRACAEVEPETVRQLDLNDVAAHDR